MTWHTAIFVVMMSFYLNQLGNLSASNLGATMISFAGGAISKWTEIPLTQKEKRRIEKKATKNKPKKLV